MTVPIKYRSSTTAVKPTVDSAKGAPLTNAEIDGNFRSIKDAHSKHGWMIDSCLKK